MTKEPEGGRILIVEDQKVYFGILSKHMKTKYDLIRSVAANKSDKSKTDDDTVLYAEDVTKFPPLVYEANPDIIVIDIELDAVSKEYLPWGHQGLSLLAKLKEYQLLNKKHEIPAVVISSKMKYPNWRDIQKSIEELAFVVWLDKPKDEQKVVNFISSILEGSRILKNVHKSNTDRKALFSALKIPQEFGIESQIERTDPPFTVNEAGHEEWAVFDASKWIVNTLMAYPGILLDSLHAATLIGLDVNSFINPEVQKKLSKGIYDDSRAYSLQIAYDGPFKEKGDFWWRSVLLEAGERLTESAETPTDLSKILEDATGVGVKKALCKYCHKDEIEARVVCYYYEVPICMEHAYGYKPPGERPLVMDPVYVSRAALDKIPRERLTEMGKMKAREEGYEVE